MRLPGRSGWISRFSCRRPSPSFPRTARTEGFVAQALVLGAPSGSVDTRVAAWRLVPALGVLARCFARVPNVRQRLLFGSALRPAPRKPRAGNAVPLFGGNQSGRVFHVSHGSRI